MAEVFYTNSFCDYVILRRETTIYRDRNFGKGVVGKLERALDKSFRFENSIRKYAQG